MKKSIWKIVIPIVAAVLLLIVLFLILQRKDKNAVVSTFGKYQGYSEASYDGHQRTSDYLALTNGTRLAYDLFLPTKKGIPANIPLPVLFKYTPYDRAWTVFDAQGHFGLADIMPWYANPMARVRVALVRRSTRRAMRHCGVPRNGVGATQRGRTAASQLQNRPEPPQ